MHRLRVLIVEDEPLIAMDLELTITEIVPAVIIIKTSVASTKEALDEPFDFAFLDIDVTNGKTYEVAFILGEKNVPFAFVSASVRSHLPESLRAIRFIPKPFNRAQIAQALLLPLPEAKEIV